MDFGSPRESTGGDPERERPGSGAMSQSPTIATPLTAEGSLIGTSHYMAPEQLEGREADARSDLWALGCVLYEMATGRRAYDGSTSASLISSIMKDEPRPMMELAPLVPPALDRVIRACLAKDPEQRWQSAHDLALALRWPALEAAAAGRAASALVQREFVLTAGHVRQLAERNPRLVGYPVTYVDNQVQSDHLVVFLHGLGADGGQFEIFLNASPYRAIAVTLVGFGRLEKRRPTLGIDDHSRVLRMLLREIVTECRPRRVLLVGHSAGADQLLRMMHDEDAAGIKVDGLIALGPNVSLDTCFATRLYARIDAANPDGTLAILKSLAEHIDSLETWLVGAELLRADVHQARHRSRAAAALRRRSGAAVRGTRRSAGRLVPQRQAARPACAAGVLERGVRRCGRTAGAAPREQRAGRRLHRELVRDRARAPLALLELGLVTRHVKDVVRLDPELSRQLISKRGSP
jgi:alpha-beta hydrolase superfamily lysophospholipase